MRNRRLLAVLLVSAGLIRAAEDPNRITITAGKSVVIDTSADVERIAVATADTVEAVAISQREVVLNGKAPGETSVIVWERGAGRVSYDVTVEASKLKLEALRARMRAEVGGLVQVDMAEDSVVLRGSVHSQLQGDHALALASMAGKPVNLLSVETPGAPQQILLKVRFAEVERSASLQLGANFFSTGAGKTIGATSTGQFAAPSLSSTSTNSTSTTATLSNLLNVFLFRPDLNLGATIEALAAKNIAQILAEPNVLASDGIEASFLAGGEFPYPVIQSSTGGINNVTIQFRQFGIRLAFTPTITPRGTIRLDVEPEVSSLDYTNGLAYGGFTIPGLDVRRVKTRIELQDGQSFAIAGLLDNRLTEQLSKIPGLGDIPLLGKLFQSRSSSRNNSELLVVVTPVLVQPYPAGSAPMINMPKEFLPTGPSVATEPDTADPKPLPVLPVVPFVPQTDAPGITAPKAPMPADTGFKPSTGPAR